MPGTLVRQIRSAVPTDSGAVYRIAATCTLAGTLPDNAIFLKRTVTANDPKDDTLERLCSPADFAEYGTDRDRAALSLGLYRSWSHTFSYADVGLATDAWAELSAMINTLVNDYDAYLTAFLTRDEGVETSYPTVDQSVKNARVEAYKARVADVAAAEQARDEHQRACRNVKELELGAAQSQLARVQASLASLRPVRSVLDVLAASYPAAVATTGASVSAAATAVAASSATSSEQTSINTQLQSAQSMLQTLIGYDTQLIHEVQTPFAAPIGALEAQETALTQEVGSAQNALAACDNEMSRLQGAVDEARRARDAALAAVREVCTDYVPDVDNDGVLAASLSLLLGGS